MKHKGNVPVIQKHFVCGARQIHTNAHVTSSRAREITCTCDVTSSHVQLTRVHASTLECALPHTQRKIAIFIRMLFAVKIRI
jgi:hypothetical protein